MATVKMQYIVQSCPQCQKQLLKVAAGTFLIGSPLITCKKCNQTYKTDLRKEWYAYPHKYVPFVVPIIIAVVALIFCSFMAEDLLIGLIAAVFATLIGFCFTIKDVIRMIKSKQRMRKLSYLDQLKKYGAITQQEYEEFSQKAA